MPKPPSSLFSEILPPETETLNSLHNASLAILDASKSHYFQGLSQVRDARTMKEILVDLRIHGS